MPIMPACESRWNNRGCECHPEAIARIERWQRSFSQNVRPSASDFFHTLSEGASPSRARSTCRCFLSCRTEMRNARQAQARAGNISPELGDVGSHKPIMTPVILTRKHIISCVLYGLSLRAKRWRRTVAESITQVPPLSNSAPAQGKNGSYEIRRLEGRGEGGEVSHDGNSPAYLISSVLISLFVLRSSR